MIELSTQRGKRAISTSGQSTATEGRVQSRRHPRFRVRLTHLLAAVIVVLPLLCVGSLILIQWVSASRSADELLLKNAALMLDAVETSLEERLAPAREYARRMAARGERLGYPMDSDRAILELRWSASSVAPEIAAVSILLPDLREVRLPAEPDGGAALEVFERAGDARYAALEDRVRRHSVAVFDGTYGTAGGQSAGHFTVFRGVWIDGEYAGAWGGTVAHSVIDGTLQTVGETFDAEAFLLTEDRRQIAGNHPLGEETRDTAPVELDRRLRAAVFGSKEIAGDLPIDGNQRGSTGDYAFAGDGRGSEYLTVSRTVELLPGLPWRIGIALDPSVLDVHDRRAAAVAAVGIVVLALSIAVGILVSRAVTVPLRQWAADARRVAQLDVDNVRERPPSRFVELDDLAQSFNVLLRGIRVFETYLPRKLVRQLLASGMTKVRSEERDVTVMFTDIVGFTTLSEGAPPEDVAQLLNDQFGLLGKHVEQFGGTIDKYIGDSLMAFWGAPEAVDNAPEMACRAALGIARDFEWYNKARKDEGRPPIRLRIGIHHGPVLVGNIGAPGRVDYTIVGDTVNACQRIEALAADVVSRDDVTILVSETVVRGLPASVDYLEVGSAALTGRRTAVTVYKLIL